jgi:hypothetical protein
MRHEQGEWLLDFAEMKAWSCRREFMNDGG